MVFPLRVMLLCGALAALFGGSATAATFNAELSSDGKVRRVIVRGPLSKGDLDHFRKIIPEAGFARIELDSRGGSLVEGLAIGEEIRARGFHTVVRSDGRCLSACALAWLAGAQKALLPGGVVGFHSSYTRWANEKRPTDEGNAIIASYLRRLGYDERVRDFVISASPDALALLDERIAGSIGLRFSRTLPRAPVTPQGTATLAANAFVDQYFAHASDPTIAPDAFVAAYFADEVNYHNVPMRRAALIETRRKMLAQWPDLSLQRQGDAEVACGTAGICVIRVVAGYEMADTARGTIASGQLLVDFTVANTPQGPRIRREVGVEMN